jgi:uncharacterized membrane protein YqjE
MELQRDNRSLGELFSTLASQTSTLVRQEVDLAKTELTQKATRASREAGMIGLGGALALGGYLALVATLIIVLDLFMPLWAAALVVGLVLAGIGYAIIQQGLKGLRRVDPAPRQTIATIKDDIAWAKEQTK